MKTESTQKIRRWFSTRRLEGAVFILTCIAFGYAFTIFPKGATVDESITDPSPAESAAVQDFSKFSHANAMHARLPCLLCHKREVGLTTPKMPGHMPCAGCHVQQFADNQNSICTICHTTTSVKPFPALRSFNVMFDHGKHTQQTNCATCHKPTRRGAAFSVPSAANGHATCFQCHGPRTDVGGRNIGSCGTCHQPGRPVRASEWAKAYSENFSHQAHIRAGNSNCSVCHTVRAGGVRGRQVSAPLPLNHHAPAGTMSCATCHNNKRAFGGDDFKDCRRCHTGKTFAF